MPFLWQKPICNQKKYPNSHEFTHKTPDNLVHSSQKAYRQVQTICPKNSVFEKSNCMVEIETTNLPWPKIFKITNEIHPFLLNEGFLSLSP